MPIQNSFCCLRSSQQGKENSKRASLKSTRKVVVFVFLVFVQGNCLFSSKHSKTHTVAVLIIFLLLYIKLSIVSTHMYYSLLLFLAFVMVTPLQNSTTIQGVPDHKINNLSQNDKQTHTQQLLAQIPNNNKPIAKANSTQLQSLRKDEESTLKNSKPANPSQLKKGTDIKLEEKEQNTEELKSRENVKMRENTLQETQAKQKQQTRDSKKQMTQLLPQKAIENDIKIIPLTAEYGKQKSKKSQGGPTSQKTISITQHEKRGEAGSKAAQKAEESVGAGAVKQVQKAKEKEEKSEQKMIQQLIEQVKNTKDKLPEQSKKEIIKYLENKKQKSHLRQDTLELQSTRQQDRKDDEEISKEKTQEYILVMDEVVDVNQKPKLGRQMDNSTILVIMALTFIISIPVVREIRSRNDNTQKEKHRKDSEILVTSKQDVLKSEGQKQYNELSNQSGYQMGEDMI